MKKLSLLTTLTLLSSTLLFSYEGCGKTHDEALSKLNENIISKVSHSSNFDLVDIKESKKGDELCLSVDKKAQVAHTNVLAIHFLTLDAKTLPKESSAAIAKLKTWLESIDKLNSLVPFFMNQLLKMSLKSILNKSFSQN